MQASSASLPASIMPLCHAFFHRAGRGFFRKHNLLIFTCSKLSNGFSHTQSKMLSMASKALQNQPLPHSDLWVSLFVLFLIGHHAHWPHSSSWTNHVCFGHGTFSFALPYVSPPAHSSLAPPCHLNLRLMSPYQRSLPRSPDLQVPFSHYLIHPSFSGSSQHLLSPHCHLKSSCSLTRWSPPLAILSPWEQGPHLPFLPQPQLVAWMPEFYRWHSETERGKMASLKSHSSSQADIIM